MRTVIPRMSAISDKMALDPLVLPHLSGHPGPCSDYKKGDMVERKDAMNYNVFGMHMYYRIKLKGA